MQEILLYSLLVFFAGIAVVLVTAHEIITGKPDTQLFGFSSQILGTYIGIAMILGGAIGTLGAIITLAVGT